MEQYYYNHMNKAQQAIYHSILSGVKNLADEFQIPALEGEELYNIFFQMRLDHPEIFWVSSYKYRYYKDSPNLIFIPEYLFDKKKICEHQKAMTARVEKLIRPSQKLSEWEKEKYVHDFICENIPVSYTHLQADRANFGIKDKAGKANFVTKYDCKIQELSLIHISWKI